MGGKEREQGKRRAGKEGERGRGRNEEEKGRKEKG